MYWILLLVLLGIAALLVWRGLARQRRGAVVAGAAVATATVVFFAWMSFWGEALWYSEVGYSDRFWSLVAARVVLGIAGGLAGGAVVYGLTRSRWAAVAGAFFGILWWTPAWSIVLPYIHAAPTGVRDPIFGRDVAFHLFDLPLYDALTWFLLIAALFSMAVVYVLETRGVLLFNSRDERGARPEWKRLLPAATAVSLILAARLALAPYHLLLSRFGVVQGAGWTDVWVRRPGYYVAAVTALLVGLALWWRPLRRRMVPSVSAPTKHGSWLAIPTVRDPTFTILGSGAGLIAAVWLGGVWIVPGLFQWLWVGPNEITVEKPYIRHNIDFTRRAFGLTDVEDQQFPVSLEPLDDSIIASNRHLLAEVRLWDPRALAAVYQQFQEIRLYYEMDSIDIDRYWLGDRYRQVMVAAREMRPGNLPYDSQTFVNRRFKYTHGYGLAMSPVSEFRLEGLPAMLIKDIPPEASAPELQVERPEIYYGEWTSEHIVANTSEPEFDYPQGAHNVYTRYDGAGGVPINTLFRRLLFGWKFDGTQLLVSSYLTEDSRILFHRQVQERVQTLAPFLSFDEDPYLVTVGGRLHWIIDGYTTSDRYPYSEAFSRGENIELPEGERVARGVSVAPPRALSGANYIRNSVKAVVDAYDGSVDYYVFTPDDPVIQVWARALPGLLKPRASMPRELERHVRYPEGLLLAQAMVYSKYHMTDPGVFYNQEDLWVRATEKYYEQVQPVDPYYVMWQPADSKRPEFILMQPFTPKNRQVLIGWIAGMCDPPNYGRLLAYHFPKEKHVLGTQQVDTKIDQDPELSAQITLWNQQGKRVIRGNVLVIPVADTLLYVEPIYIQAEVAAYPELRLVVVMHNNRMAHGPSFDAALANLLQSDREVDRQLVAGTSEPSLELESWRVAAGELEAYFLAISEERFVDAGRHLERLRQLLSSERRE